MAVTVDRKPKEEPRNVELTSPHGTEIIVGATRAETLLSRAPLPFNDGTFRKYARKGESTLVGVAQSGASGPRKGLGVNSPGGE